MNLEAYTKFTSASCEIVWIDGKPWQVHDRLLTPLTPPNTRKPVNREFVRKAMRQTGAILAQWTDAWDTVPCSWWYIACDDKEYDLTKLASDARANVRKCLKTVEVRKLEIDEFIQKGYSVYAAAVQSYGPDYRPASQEEFEQGAMRQGLYPGRETWGALLSDKLIAFASCIVVGDVTYVSASKSDPEYHKFRPNNGVQYTLTREYLLQRGLSVVIRGSRSILHETKVQDFALRMGYRRIFTPVHVELSPFAALAIAMKVHQWGRFVGLKKLAPGMLRKYEAVASLVRIAKECDMPGLYGPHGSQDSTPKATPYGL